MTASSTEQTVASVVAWHNRHPLACRISSDHVQGIGWVSLPFSTAAKIEPGESVRVAPGASLRERALARNGEPTPPAVPSIERGGQPNSPVLRPSDRAFTERFIAPWRPAGVSAFVLSHGRAGGVLESDQPLRELPLSDGQARATVCRQFIRTAAVEFGGRRSRVLVAVDGSAVWGRRVWHRGRLTALLVGLALVAGGLWWLTRTQGPAPQAAGGQTLAGTSSASSPALAAASASRQTGPGVAKASAPASTAASTSTSDRAARNGAAAAPTGVPASMPTGGVTLPGLALGASAPSPVTRQDLPAPPSSDRGGSSSRVDIRPRLSSEEARAARLQSSQARGGTVAAAPIVPLQPRPATPSGASSVPRLSGAGPRSGQVSEPVGVAPVMGQAVPATAGAGRSFAVVARSTRTRAASEVMLGLMRGAAGVSAQQRVEVLPVGQDWRATWWPFAGREAAERAQAELALVGLQVEVIEF